MIFEVVSTYELSGHGGSWATAYLGELGLPSWMQYLRSWSGEGEILSVHVYIHVKYKLDVYIYFFPFFARN